VRAITSFFHRTCGTLSTPINDSRIDTTHKSYCMSKQKVYRIKKHQGNGAETGDVMENTIFVQRICISSNSTKLKQKI
jgi:hypothetical protein